mmetsp:Transcript_70890/g.198760  ORF Transcript_70890/g.198760 Transcript_70890/m.198760 type:complete len:261 (+) Transcript_70890:232-1014(+)
MYASNPAGDAAAAITPSITSSASRDALLQAYLQSRPGARETPRHQRRSRKPGFYGFERSEREPEQAAKRRASVQRRLSVLQQEQRGPGRGQGQGQGRARAFTTGGAGAEESKGAAESPSSSAQASALPAAAPILQRALTDEAKQVAGRLMINDQMQLFMTKNNLKNDLRKKRISVRTYRAEEVEAGRSFNRLVTTDYESTATNNTPPPTIADSLPPLPTHRSPYTPAVALYPSSTPHRHHPWTPPHCPVCPNSVRSSGSA